MTSPHPTPDAGAAGGPHRRTLANGLRIVLAPHWPTPRTAVAVHYGAGFRSERPGQEGMAHLFEHLMFRGSESLPDGAFYDALHPLAGAANGTTHQDYTDYFQTVPAQALEQALFREADRMRAPRFTPGQLAAQLAEVAREIEHMRDGRPYGGLPWPLLPQVMFRDFASAHDGYGDARELGRVTVEDCARFFEAYYTPSNAVVTVVGPHRPEDVWPLVERHFGDIPRRATAEPPPLDEPLPTGERRLRRTVAGVPRTAVAVGHRLPDPAARPGAYLAHMVLAELTQRSAAQELAAPVSAGCGFFGPLDARGPDALVVTSLLPRGLTAGEFTDRLTAWWARHGDPRTVAGAAEGAVRSLASRLRREHADLQQRCRALGRLELLFGRAELVDELPGLVEAIASDDLAQAATALAAAPRAVLVLEPEAVPAEGAEPPTRTEAAPAQAAATSATPAAGAPRPGTPAPLTQGAPLSEATAAPAQGSPAHDTPRHTTPAATPAAPTAHSATTPAAPAQVAPAPGASTHAAPAAPAARRPPTVRAQGEPGQDAPAPGTPAPAVPAVDAPVRSASAREAKVGGAPTAFLCASLGTSTAQALAPRGAVELGRTSLGPRPLPPPGEPVGPRFTGAKETVLAGGPRVLAVPDRRAGLVEVRLRVPLGPDGWRRPAESAWLLRRADAATGASARARRLGGELRVSTGGQWVDIGGWAPREAYSNLLRIVADLLEPPPLPDAFPPAAAVAPRLSPEQRMDQALRLHWLGGDADDVLPPTALYRRMLAPKGTVFVVVGDVEPERAAEEAARLLGPWASSAAAERADAPTTGTGPPGTADAPVVLVVREPSAGGAVGMTLCAPEPAHSDDVPARYLATALLGGHYGARLAERCRRLGRAGHVMFAARDVVADRARALVRVTAPRAEVAQALHDVREEAAALAAVPPTRDELDVVRRYCGAQLLTAFDSPGLLADALRHTMISGRGLEWVISRPQLLGATTGEEVASAAKALFVPVTNTVVALGDVEQQALAGELEADR
ncbi:insulinase family protein [Streptomyces sp. PKU-EA00015]|uniref:M16 family metallopeptidase n=1 Tax=Streptomyces sp. PKU-EA00015 TaxID=2748326 RepID=UPI0015A00236|nr:M16 family metallopeptidase [Streptomyces sp. PKU-EA00015]NWF28202.1 insulinase family protein [Streptomyces sp. PKU-EA00015]